MLSHSAVTEMCSLSSSASVTLHKSTQLFISCLVFVHADCATSVNFEIYETIFKKHLTVLLSF